MDDVAVRVDALAGLTAGDDPDQDELARFETGLLAQLAPGGGLGTEYLVTRTHTGVHGLVAFYRGIGDGRPWRDAFEHAFGLPVESFYAGYEAYRQSAYGPG